MWRQLVVAPYPATVLLALTVAFFPGLANAQRIYQNGQNVYLDNDQGVRLGIKLDWGGVIVEVSQAGENAVDAKGIGGDIQLALFDGNASYQKDISNNDIGYNPTQGGDIYNHGSSVVASSFVGGVLYTKTLPIEWNPNNKGGGPTVPVPSDLYIEQWIRFLPGFTNVFDVHYKITHFGGDVHAVTLQGLPAVYTLLKYDRCVTYSGSNAWRGDSESFVTLPVIHDLSKIPFFAATESWFASVTSANTGLTVYFPDTYPFFSGLIIPAETGFPGNTFGPVAFASLVPSGSFEGDYYLIPGDYRDARQQIYRIRSSATPVDVMSPFGFVDGARCAPIPGNRAITISGAPVISGWTVDNVGVAGADYYVDGLLRGHASYGNPRDVSNVWPGLPNVANSGFQFTLDTSQYTEGAHQLEVKVSDSAGNVGILPRLYFRTAKVVRREAAGAPGGASDRLPIKLSARHGEPNAYGFFGPVDSTGAALGWAVDPDVLPSSTDVLFVVDGPTGTGTAAGTTTANVSRPSLNTQCGFQGNHGFSFAIPAQFRDGHPHTIYAYALDTSGHLPVLLPGSPISFQLN